jgi:hypothetical protein
MHDLWHHLAPLAGAFHSFIALILGAFIVAVRKYMQRVRENQAAMWPSADGQVQTATVKKSQYGSWVEVSYRYYARQEYRYGKYRRHFARKAAAQAFADAIRGRSFQVRFRDDNPNESVVLEQDLQMTGVLQTG